MFLARLLARATDWHHVRPGANSDLLVTPGGGYPSLDSGVYGFVFGSLAPSTRGLARFADVRARACARALCARLAQACVPAPDALPVGVQVLGGALRDEPSLAEQEQDEARAARSRVGWAQAWLQGEPVQGDSVRALLLQVAPAHRAARVDSLQAGEQARIRGGPLLAQAAPPRAHCAECA